MAFQPKTDRSRLLKPGLPPLPANEHWKAATDVIAALQKAGHEAYLVGGFVRDWLLGLEPGDYDIATSAHPEHVQALFPETRAVGAHFGVVLVRHGGYTHEVATFRTDLAYKDSRRPEGVTYGTLEDDAVRRDFTVNALYYDPLSGRIVDLVEGRLDLRRRILRTVGAPVKRFEEDALRLLRAVRFACHYELEIEEKTRKAFKVRVKNLENISRERIGEELVKILRGPHRYRSITLMSELGLWAFVIPEIEALRGVEQGRELHPEGDVFTHTALAVDRLPDHPPASLALGTLLHDIGKPATATRDEEGHIRFFEHQHVGARMAREICTRLKYSRELTDEVVRLVEGHMEFLQVRDMRPSKIKRFVSRPDFWLHLALHRADCLASDGDLSAYDYCVGQRKLVEEEHGEELLPPSLASGDDLIALGLPPGPAYKTLLDDLHDEQLEGRIQTREQALQFLKEKSGKTPEP
jgi:putative nucleotidyltransferase with HDIG domain